MDAPKPRSTIDDYRMAVHRELGSIEARTEYLRQDGKAPHPESLRRADIWTDLLTLLGKLELCRADIKKLFDAKRPLFLARGFLDPITLQGEQPPELPPADESHAVDGQTE